MQNWAKKKPTKDYFSNYLNLSCNKISQEIKKHWHNYVFTTSLFLLSLSHFLALRTMKKLFAVTRWLSGKESACQAGDLDSIPGLWRSPGEGTGYPFQYSGLENSMDSPWGRKESDMTEWLSFTYEIFSCQLKHFPDS